jgi:hypothetical protein
VSPPKTRNGRPGPGATVATNNLLTTNTIAPTKCDDDRQVIERARPCRPWTTYTVQVVQFVPAAIVPVERGAA